MEPKNRRPVYASDSKRRVISAPNGLWQAQQRRAFPQSRTDSGWDDLGSPQSYPRACLAAGVKMEDAA